MNTETMHPHTRAVLSQEKRRLLSQLRAHFRKLLKLTPENSLTPKQAALLYDQAVKEVAR